MAEPANNPSLTQVELTIIIPVYNKASHLNRCLESAIAQIADSSFAEIVLIDDGSTDQSSLICTAYARKYPFISFYRQDNLGVSAARNTGIQHARGTYLLFLDADDQLGPGSVSAILKFFRSSHDDVDIITYPIAYVDTRTDVTTLHKRSKVLKTSGVYPLDLFPEICQTTMNVCVKRTAALSHRFSNDFTQGEDQLFIASIAAPLAAIGYCTDALYLYTRNGTGESGRKSKPVYAFDQMISLYSQLLEIGKAYPKAAEYCRQLVLYNFKWRMSAESLFPDFGSCEDRQTNYERLLTIARSIPSESYFKSKYLSGIQKKYLLERLGLFPNNIELEYEGPRLTITSNRKQLWTVKTPILRVVRCVATKTTMRIMGILEGAALSLDSRQPLLHFRYGLTHGQLSLLPSSREYSGAHVKTTRSWYFMSELPIPNKPTELTFTLYMGDESVELSKIIPSFTRANARKGPSPKTRYFENALVHIKKNYAIIEPKKLRTRIRESVRICLQNDDDVSLRKQHMKFRQSIKGKNIWLYSDLPASPEKGNALIQILHDLNKEDGVVRRYVTQHQNDIESRYPALKGHLIEYRSREHMFYYLAADVVLTSFIDVPTFTPCERAVYDKYGDLSKPKHMIYLQHGILHAHIPWYLSFDRTMFDYEVVSTQFEIDNLTSNYYFPADRLIASGAPRLDILQHNANHRNKVIYAPSWRSYLIGGNAKGRIATRDRFVESTFYQETSAFITAIARSGILDEFDYTFELKLHPNFEPYKELFHLEHPRMKVIDYPIDEADYAVMVTDYSSYLYDFLYTGAKVMRYLPDRREFEGGANHYTKIDLPPDCGLDEFAETPAQALSRLAELLRSIEPSCNGANVGKQTGSEKPFFIHSDGRNSERLYAHIRNLER